LAHEKSDLPRHHPVGSHPVLSPPDLEERDPLYLFACQLQWEKRSDPSAAWEVISAARSSHADTRAHARALLERMLLPEPKAAEETAPVHGHRRNFYMEAGMRTPYGLDIIESCIGCKASRDGFFCHFSQKTLRTFDAIGHHTVMPAGALLFIEGHKPRGVFVLCSGSVRLSTTSKEGKMLVLKQASAGEALGLSAALSGTNYEVSAETATPCQLDFIGRPDLMMMLQTESEMGVRSAMWLSHDFQSAYRDIHDLVLARSSSGKLARLLLSSSVPGGMPGRKEVPLTSTMTHEEMAQRIGTSRETVTRWLTEMRKKRLIRRQGDTLIIRDPSALEAMTV
jgi:CRP/FNR family transcriptional regulator, cyclic AMP receptor protein